MNKIPVPRLMVAAGLSLLIALLAIPSAASAAVTRAEVEKALTTITGNALLGNHALEAATGERNVAIGDLALTSLTTGEENVAVGAFALKSTIAASKNVAVGDSAMASNETGSLNVAAGNSALLDNTTGTANTAVGGSAAIDNTTGNRNTAVGREALDENTTGEKNTGVGYNALNQNKTGSENTAVGVDALGFPPEVSVSKNTALGFFAGFRAEGSGNVFIGWEAGAKFTGSNQLFIANSQTATPLIFGNFETKAATVNGTLEISESPAKPAKPEEGKIETGPIRMAARKTTFAIVGNGATSTWTLKHALNTRLVTVSVQAAEGEEPGEIEPPGNYKVKASSNAEVKVTFNTAPAPKAEYFITVIG